MAGFRRSPKRPLRWRMERGLDQLANSLEVLGQFVSEPGAAQHPDLTSWITQLVSARTDLESIIAATSATTSRSSPPLDSSPPTVTGSEAVPSVTSAPTDRNGIRSSDELIAEIKQRRLEDVRRSRRAPVQRQLETDYAEVAPSVWPGQLDAAERGLPFDPDIVARGTAGDELGDHGIRSRQTREWLQTRIKFHRPSRGLGAKGKRPGDLDPWLVAAAHSDYIAKDPSRWNSKSAVAHLALELDVGERTIRRCLKVARTIACTDPT